MYWSITTCGPETVVGRFRRIADVTGPAAPVAIDTLQSQDGTAKEGLHRPRLSAIILSSRSLALIQIAGPFSSRLSRYNRHDLTILSRNKRHFAPMDLAVVDPYQKLPVGM